jgi:protein-disulfide isomerase
MQKKTSWLIVLVVLVLLIAACGPEMITPTPGTDSATNTSPPPTESTGEDSGNQTSSAGQVMVDASDWHVLGSPDAPVTMVEYSDFQ